MPVCARLKSSVRQRIGLNFRNRLVVADPFLQPVDWKAWGLDDYPTIVKQPMDLSKVEVSSRWKCCRRAWLRRGSCVKSQVCLCRACSQKKLEDGEYDNIMDFSKDVNLIWSNCMLYNQVCGLKFVCLFAVLAAVVRAAVCSRRMTQSTTSKHKR
jgi:hypothetical protein